MRLQFANGICLDNPSQEDVLDALETVCLEADRSVLLEDHRGRYVRVDTLSELSLDLRWFDAPTGMTFRCTDHPIELEDVCQAFLAFLEGRADWAGDWTWADALETPPPFVEPEQAETALARMVRNQRLIGLAGMAGAALGVLGLLSDRRTAETLVPAGLVLGGLAAWLHYLNKRCPACGRYLGVLGRPGFCRRCSQTID